MLVSKHGTYIKHNVFKVNDCLRKCETVTY